MSLALPLSLFEVSQATSENFEPTPSVFTPRLAATLGLKAGLGWLKLDGSEPDDSYSSLPLNRNEDDFMILVAAEGSLGKNLYLPILLFLPPNSFPSTPSSFSPLDLDQYL